MIFGKRIFIAPLDWGQGHATRCVPIIRELLQNGNQVLLGVTPSTHIIFDQEFPELEKINIPAYNIRYSSVFPVWIKLLMDAPRILKVIKEENNFLKSIIQNHKIEVVISDNRFGLYNPGIQSIFITHQLFIKAPIGRWLAQKINKKYILEFSEVWVPDYEESSQSLSGELSHGKHFHLDVKYIGPKSRLPVSEAKKKLYDYVFLLSGPEPQKSDLKKILLRKAEQYPNYQFALISQDCKTDDTQNLKVFNSPDGVTLSRIISESITVICRSGYSTLMDLHLLGVKKNVILVPTPGQIEQEYLAEYWRLAFGSVVIKQKDLGDLKF